MRRSRAASEKVHALVPDLCERYSGTDVLNPPVNWTWIKSRTNPGPHLERDLYQSRTRQAEERAQDPECVTPTTPKGQCQTATTRLKIPCIMTPKQVCASAEISSLVRLGDEVKSIRDRENVEASPLDQAAISTIPPKPAREGHAYHRRIETTPSHQDQENAAGKADVDALPGQTWLPASAAAPSAINYAYWWISERPCCFQTSDEKRVHDHCDWQTGCAGTFNPGSKHPGRTLRSLRANRKAPYGFWCWLIGPRAGAEADTAKNREETSQRRQARQRDAPQPRTT